MNDTETFRQIMRNTGRRPGECQRCREQYRTPRLATPDDIFRLIEKEYADKLAISCWMVGVAAGKLPVPIPMVQAKRTENGCVFFGTGSVNCMDKA